VSIIADGVKTSEIEDLAVEIVAGEGSVSKPFYGKVSSNYLQTDLGGIEITEGGQIKTDVNDNSLIRITYQTKYRQFTVTDARIEDVQFFPEEASA